MREGDRPGRMLSGSQKGCTRRFGAALSMALIVCRRAGDASRNFEAIFIVQEVSFDTTQSVLELIPNKSFAVISIARHRSAIRVEAVAFPNLLEGHTKSNV
jgi:hypothetical protein